MSIKTRLLTHGVNAVRHYGLPPLPACTTNHQCKLLVVGGGTGGCSIAWRFARKLKPQDIIVVEPSQIHYYQPLFTLVGAGIKKFKESHREEASVLPKEVRWIRDSAIEFDPGNCVVYTCGGNKICYEFMVVAVGLVNDYDQITGLKEALDDPQSGVSTIYSPDYCEKTWSNIRCFKGGHAVFTFPKAAAKCSGAAQKIMYLAHDYWREHKTRHLANVTYVTACGSIFGVEKYANVLMRIAEDRRIAVNYCRELVALSDIGAVFVDEAGETTTLPYNLLHVTPPMSPPAHLRQCTDLVTPGGYLSVDPRSLRHQRFDNVFGVGDCLCTPNSKTAAAVAAQTAVVERNLFAVMKGKEPTAQYNGYGACPLLTSYSKGILAEFLYDKKICETFPFDQSKERRFLYHLKANILPSMYWKKMVKGKWDGPGRLRKIINPFGK